MLGFQVGACPRNSTPRIESGVTGLRLLAGIGFVELGDRLAPSQRVFLVRSSESRDLLRNSCAHFLRAGIGRNRPDLSLGVGAATDADSPRALSG